MRILNNITRGINRLGINAGKPAGLPGALRNKFLFLWTGGYTGDNLKDSLGSAAVITVTNKDWTTRYIDPDTAATFAVPDNATFLGADGTDNFWFSALDALQQKTLANLIASTTLRTFIKYADFEPYFVYGIGILKAGETLTDADKIKLNRYFKLWAEYWGVLMDSGYMKDNRIVDESWSSYWTHLISAVVDSDNPADIILTFDQVGSGLVASDFTVAGYTISSLTYDVTGKIITLTCTANVLATTVTFNKGVGLTANVVVELARNTDEVLSLGYYEVTEPVGALGAFTPGGRLFLDVKNNTKIRQNGTITKVKFYISDVTDVTEVFFDVFRKDGATWDRVHHVDIYALLTADIVNTVTLPVPLSVLEGDAIGLAGKQTTAGLAVLGCLAEVLGLLILESYQSENVTLAGSWGNYLPIQTFAQAPLIVGIGDSLIAGHDINYSNIENSITVDLDGHILAQLYILNNKYVFQNMGIGSTSSTTNVARFTADVVDLKPKIALIGGFMSGLIQSENQATMIANLTTMLDACIAAGIAPIVCKINPWTNGTNEQMQTRDTIMAAMQILTATYPSAVWVDFDTAIGQFRVGGDDGNLWDIQADYNGDGVHLNQAGYTKMAEVINTAILTKYTLA